MKRHLAGTALPSSSARPAYPFRRGTVRQPSARRVEKYAHRRIADFCVGLCYLTIPFRPYGPGAVIPLVHTVIRKFFLLQYFQKIHVTHRPVKHVDHALDEKVPFKPDAIWCYLGFINIWIRPLAMLLHRFGSFSGTKLAAEFLRYFTHTYREAYRMYSLCMTTTYRPPCRMLAIKNIRRADPHYLCVPSLHIAIVCLTFSFYRMIFRRERFTEGEAERWYAELYAHAVEIGEAVLYVKQHSVNCIPAALYMLTRIAPELFTPEDAVAFISELFKNATDVLPDDKAAITAHIQFMYERFLLEGNSEEDWVAPVARWLSSYEPHRPSYAEEPGET